MPENQTSWNSDNHRIKETVKQNNQTSKAVDRETPWWGSRLWRWGWMPPGGRLCGRGLLKGKLSLGDSCGLQWLLLQWEKLPVSHESSLKSGLEKSRWAAWFPLWPLPHRQHRAAKGFALPWWIRKVPPPYNLTGVPRQRNMAQMKEQSKTSERKLSNEEIANLSDGEFKALVIKMLTDLIELGRKMKKTNEGYPNWNKAKYSGSQQWQGRKPGLKAMIWNKRKKINIHLEQSEETRIQKVKRVLQTSGTTWNIPISEL